MNARRSIAVRIYAGFLVVLVAFAAVLGYTVLRSDGVRRQLELINQVYLRLTRLCSELHLTQSRLNHYVTDRASGTTPTRFLRRQIKLTRQYRLKKADAALALVAEAVRAGPRAGQRQLLESTHAQLKELRRGFLEDEPRFERLFSTPELPAQAVSRIGAKLLRGERKLEQLTRALRKKVRGQLRHAALAVEQDQRNSLWAGLGLLLLAVLLGVAMMLRGRRLLMPLRTLVEGTRRIASGDYAGRIRVASQDELGQLADEFNKMAAAVEERETRLIRSERMAAAGLLASHITHEVRNPLNSISLNTEMLEEELAEAVGTKADEPRALCRAIRQEVDRLTDITEEYLRFARLPKPNLQPEDVNELLASLLEFLHSELAECSVNVELRLSESPPVAEVDESQLRQALLNLIRNAREAMPDGGHLTVATDIDGLEEAGTSGTPLAITIADTGPGIAEARLQTVFEPFFTTKDGGTGLGLAITQEIIQQHGGQITVESAQGVGTTFTVKLPLTHAP